MAKLLTLSLAAMLTLISSSCARERHFVPHRAEVRYELPQWPRGTVTLAVVDARLKKTDDSERLVGIVTTIMTTALAAAQGPPTALRMLSIAIADHEVTIGGGRWTAETRFRATLQEGPRQLAAWTAVGRDRQFNMLPAYVDAKRASQSSFNRAIAELMTKLSILPSPTATSGGPVETSQLPDTLSRECRQRGGQWDWNTETCTR